MLSQSSYIRSTYIVTYIMGNITSHSNAYTLSSLTTLYMSSFCNIELNTPYIIVMSLLHIQYINNCHNRHHYITSLLVMGNSTVSSHLNAYTLSSLTTIFTSRSALLTSIHHMSLSSPFPHPIHWVTVVMGNSTVSSHPNAYTLSFLTTI
jgi:hypothetical protein